MCYSRHGFLLSVWQPGYSKCDAIIMQHAGNDTPGMIYYVLTYVLYRVTAFIIINEDIDLCIIQGYRFYHYQWRYWLMYYTGLPLLSLSMKIYISEWSSCSNFMFTLRLNRSHIFFGQSVYNAFSGFLLF